MPIYEQKDVIYWNYKEKCHFKNNFPKSIVDKDKKAVNSIANFDKVLIYHIECQVESQIMYYDASYHMMLACAEK